MKTVMPWGLACLITLAAMAAIAALVASQRRRTRIALSDARWKALALKRRLVEVSARCAFRVEGCHSPSKGRADGCMQDGGILPSDLLMSVFVNLPLTALRRAACVSTDWHSVAQSPSLYAIVDRAMLGDKRRVARSVLLALAEKHVCEETVELNLAGVRCVDDSLVATFASRAPSLTAVDLSACAVGDEALAALADGCPKLERLHMWATDELTNAGLISLSAAIARHRCSGGGGGSGGGCGGGLRMADLRACTELSDAGLVPLVQACGARLTSLRLKGVAASTGDETLRALGSNCPNLTLLDASGLDVTNLGVDAIGLGCPLLATVLFSGCKRLGDLGVSALARGCGERLRLLDLQGCSTTSDESALALASHCAGLHTVSFQCCPLLTDRGFNALCAGCALAHVTLKHCQVSEDAVREAQRARPQLTVRVIPSGRLL